MKTKVEGLQEWQIQQIRAVRERHMHQPLPLGAKEQLRLTTDKSQKLERKARE